MARVDTDNTLKRDWIIVLSNKDARMAAALCGALSEFNVSVVAMKESHQPFLQHQDFLEILQREIRKEEGRCEYSKEVIESEVGSGRPLTGVVLTAPSPLKRDRADPNYDPDADTGKKEGKKAKPAAKSTPTKGSKATPTKGSSQGSQSSQPSPAKPKPAKLCPSPNPVEYTPEPKPKPKPKLALAPKPAAEKRNIGSVGLRDYTKRGRK
jgi:cell division protein FtsN